MAFNENIPFWNNQTVADGQTMSAPLEKLLENDKFLKNELKVFFAEYEITTFEEVTNALAANKMVFLRKTITVSEENHVIYLPLSNKKESEPNVYTFSGISGHRGNLVISFTLSENDIWSLGNDSFPSKEIQVVAYGSTSLSDINSYFNEGLYLVCNRGGEYLPLISRSLINDSYEYIFSGSYEDKVVKLKCEVSGWSEEVINLKMIKDNAYDSVTDPINSDNITDIKQLTFVRNVGVDANYTMVESEARGYGVLIPPPSMQADHNKVPMYKNGNQIAWETVPTEESVTAEIAAAVSGKQDTLNLNLFIKGDTIYGGTIANNLNTIAKTGFYTCDGTATGVPNGDYSWFVIHENSNAGTVFAKQTATAFIRTSIITYVRVKNADGWGAWLLQGSGGLSSLAYDGSMDSAAAVDNVDLYAGSDSQWSAHAVLWKPKTNMSPVVNTSTLNVIMQQPVPGKQYIIAAYKYMSSGTHELLCATAINSMPANQSIISPVITSKLADFVGGQTTYFVVFTNANGVKLCGRSRQSNLNIQPYTSAQKANLGVLTEAPATLTFENENTNNLFVSVTI